MDEEEIKKIKLDLLLEVGQKICDYSNMIYEQYVKAPRLFKKNLDESNGMIHARNIVAEIYNKIKE